MRRGAWSMAVNRLRSARSFGPASEEPYRRRGSDAIRLVFATIVLAVLARRAGRVSTTEASLFQLFNSLPSGFRSLFIALYRLGALWAVALVAVAALGARRWRLARDLSLAGLLAWAIARGLGVAVNRGIGGGLRAVLRFGITPAFPLVRLAVITAVLAAASPYLTRPTRRIGGALVLALAAAAMYLGTAFPNDLMGALVLGWGVAASIHFTFGSPGGRPTSAQVAASLAEVGLELTHVRLAPEQHAGSTVMVASDRVGDVRIRLIGRDEADARLLAKLWRFLYYKDSGPKLFLSRAQQLEHEAYTMLLARAAGVRVPEMVIAGTAGPGIAVAVERDVGGITLTDARPDDINDEVLDDVWHQVARLHRALVTHGGLNGRHVRLTAAGPTLVDFSAALAPAPSDHRAADVAELLVATAVAVGEDRAVEQARSALGPDVLAMALPLLQPAALTRAGRAAAGNTRKEVGDRLDRLRQAAATATGTAPPALEQLQRVRTSSVVMAVGALFGVGALLSAIGDPSPLIDSLRAADPWWMVVAFAFSMLANVGYALALMGAVARRLPLVPNLEVQVAGSFSNLALPLGGTGLQIRFLQKQGVPLASAIIAGGLLSTVAGVGVQLGLLVVALWLSPHTVRVNGIPTHGVVTGIVYGGAVVAAVAALVIGVPLLRRRLMPPIEHALSPLWAVFRSPGRVALLIAGNVIASSFGVLSLLACLEAYGHPISLWTLLAVNISVGTLASLVPIPGGGTAVASVGMSGALVAFNVPQAAAAAAVLTNQVVGTYLPAIPGWLATTHLVRHDFL